MATKKKIDQTETPESGTTIPMPTQSELLALCETICEGDKTKNQGICSCQTLAKILLPSQIALYRGTEAYFSSYSKDNYWNPTATGGKKEARKENQRINNKLLAGDKLTDAERAFALAYAKAYPEG